MLSAALNAHAGAGISKSVAFATWFDGHVVEFTRLGGFETWILFHNGSLHELFTWFLVWSICFWGCNLDVDYDAPSTEHLAPRTKRQARSTKYPALRAKHQALSIHNVIL